MYAMNFNDENMNEIEIKPEGIGSGENIVFVANQFWNASGSSDDKFNYLIVGTQSGDNYKLYSELSHIRKLKELRELRS